MDHHYLCTVFNHPYTSASADGWLGPEHVAAVQVAVTAVRGRNRREAAARAYVRTVGRVRARLLREMKAPAILARVESCWRVLVGSLGRTRNWLGDCFVFDTSVERFFVRVERRPGALPTTNRQRARRLRRFQAARSPVIN